MRLVRSWRRLPSRRRRLIVPALLVLVCVRLALSLLPYRTRMRCLEALRRHTSRMTPGDATPEDVARVVARVSAVVPLASCLTQALATCLLLRPDEKTARLRIGVRHGEAGGLQAHAWIETDAGVLLGDDELEAYAPLTRRERVESTPESRPATLGGTTVC